MHFFPIRFYPILVLFMSISINLFGQENNTKATPAILDEKSGDLDGDGIPEKAIVYNTTDTTEDGIVRELRILKKSGDEWVSWKSSRNAVLKSQQGGMMGDPFEGIEITKGLLIISVSGGSSWKWSHKDKYRFQHNEFEMIGYASHFGKPCEYWGDFDFNLSTGKIIYKKEYEDCEKGQAIYKRENETFYKKGVRLNLNNRYLKDIKIISPKNKHELYL